MVYFYDKDNRYIGCREGNDRPFNATDIPLVLTDGQEAHFIDGAWLITDMVIEPVQIVPQEPTELERIDALENVMLLII